MTENLTRTYQKIFAKNAGAQGKTVFGSTAQGNTQYTTDISAMQSEAYENGFADAVVSKKAPVMQDFNTVENITTTQLAYLFQKGIPEWNSETTYFKGNIVLNIESDIPVLYYSLIDNNLNNQVSDTESWKKVSLDINIDNKANISLDNLDETGQALFTNKADIDFNNINTTAKELIYTAGAPDYTNKTDITINVEYTASSNGYIYLYGTETAGVRYYLTINGIIFEWDNTATANASGFILMPIAKNDTYKVSSSSGVINNYKGYFIPMKTI